MNIKKQKSCFLNISALTIVGVLLILLTAVALLWHLNANSMQA